MLMDQIILASGLLTKGTLIHKIKG